MAWLLDNPDLADGKPHQTWHRPRVALFEPADAPRFGSNDNRDYHNALCLLARHHWTFANDRLDEPAELRIVADGGRDFSPEELKSLSEYARAGGKLLVLSDPTESTGETIEAGRSLAAALDLSGTEQASTPHTTEHTYPSGGRVVVLASDRAVQNERLAPHLRVPSAEEAGRAELLLDLVRQLLDD